MLKKFLLPAALFLVSFAAVNAGMYFFLSATQPKMGKRANATPVKADSAATALRPDSTNDMAHESIPADSAQQNVPEQPKPVTASMGDLSETSSLPPADVLPKADTVAVENATEDSEQASGTSAAQQAANLAQKPAGDVEMAKLAKLLESMKPDEAAAIASSLTTDQIVQLVMRMKDRAAGKMLAALPVEQAAQVAVKMSKSTTQNKVRS